MGESCMEEQSMPRGGTVKTLALEQDHDPTAQEAPIPPEYVPKVFQYIESTARGIEAMTDATTGLVYDRIEFTEQGIVNNEKTSPTNIGLQIAHIKALEKLEILDSSVADAKISKILDSVERLPHHNGLFFSWYNPRDLSVVVDPKDTNEHHKNGRWISSVDNAWMAEGLALAARTTSDPEIAQKADFLLHRMTFADMYNPLTRLYHGEIDANTGKKSDFEYPLLLSETRAIVYTGIQYFNMPEESLFALRKYAPPGEDEPSDMSPSDLSTYGGAMFEAMLPKHLYPEDAWSKHMKQAGLNVILDQIRYGDEHNYGYWGFSPCEHADHQVGYQAYGTPGHSICPYGVEGTVTPHAVALAVILVGRKAIHQLMRQENDFPGLYNQKYGFMDSAKMFVTEEGKEVRLVARHILALDAMMTNISLFSGLTGGGLANYGDRSAGARRLRRAIRLHMSEPTPEDDQYHQAA